MSGNAPPAGITRGFWIVWGGQTASAFGSSLTAFALAVWLYQRTGSLTLFGSALALQAAVTAVVAPWAGHACDRYRLRTLMMLSDLAAAALTLVLALLAATGTLAVWHVVAAMAVDGAASALHQIAWRSAVPQLVAQDRLARANGAVDAGLTTGSLIGPPVAAALLACGGIGAVLAVDAVSFVAAVVSIRFAAFPIVATHADERAPTPVAGGVLAGWFLIRREPALRWLMASTVAGTALVSALQVLLPPLTLATHSAAVLGALTTLMAGSGLATAAFVAWRSPVATLSTVRRAQAVMGAGFVMLGAVSPIWAIGAAVVVIQAAAQWGGIAVRTLWQRSVEPALRGRVFACLTAVSAVVAPLSMLVVPVVAERVAAPLARMAGVDPALWGGPVTLAACGVLAIALAAASGLAAGVASARGGEGGIARTSRG